MWFFWVFKEFFKSKRSQSRDFFFFPQSNSSALLLWLHREERGLMSPGKLLVPLRCVTYVAWSCEMVLVLCQELVDGFDDSGKLRNLAEMLQGRRKCSKVCVWRVISSLGIRMETANILLTLCSICPGGTWACSDLILWACERRGEGRNIFLLWVSRELPCLSAPSTPWDHSRAPCSPLRLPGAGCCERHVLDFSN